MLTYFKKLTQVNVSVNALIDLCFKHVERRVRYREAVLRKNVQEDISPLNVLPHAELLFSSLHLIGHVERTMQRMLNNLDYKIKYQIYLIIHFFKDAVQFELTECSELIIAGKKYDLLLDELIVYALRFIMDDQIQKQLEEGIIVHNILPYCGQHLLEDELAQRLLVLSFIYANDSELLLDLTNRFPRLKQNGNYCAFAAANNKLDILVFMHEDLGYVWNEKTCVCAIVGRSLDCLKYAHEHDCPWTEISLKTTIQAKNLECLDYAFKNKCPYNYTTICTYAAKCGFLDGLIYLVGSLVPTYEDTIYTATKYGFLDCLKWLHEINEEELTEMLFITAAEYGHLHCLKYLYDQGCPRSYKAYILAYVNEHEACYRFIYEHMSYTITANELTINEKIQVILAQRVAQVYDAIELDIDNSEDFDSEQDDDDDDEDSNEDDDDDDEDSNEDEDDDDSNEK